MEETLKPTSTWQTFNSETNTLTVYKGDNEASGIHFQGRPEDYDGSATEPASPTSEYLAKQAEEAKAKAENDQPTAEAATEAESEAEDDGPILNMQE